MFLGLASLAALFVVSEQAFAAPDVSATLTVPTGLHVYETGRYTVTVSNTGNQNASAVSLTIQLPRTHTSPQVYVEGTLGAKSGACTQTGTDLLCSLGAIAKRRSTSVYFDLALPEAIVPLSITATATTARDGNHANDGDTETPVLADYDVTAFGGSGPVMNRHCTGTDLASFFECELFPSSISSHEVELLSDGTIAFSDPSYGGTWWQDSPDHLAFVYTELGTVVAEFEGWGVDASCWEGATYFPGSAYMSMYEVCVQ